MELKLINEQGLEATRLEVSDLLFGREYNEALVHQVLVAYQANARSGDRAQKDRRDVRHTTKKPWRQKGTGRARAGMSSSPIWRGGGRVFPNSPDENFSQKLNRKMYRAGMATILSQLVRQDRLAVIEGLSVDVPKTRVFAAKIKRLGYESVLVITDDLTEELFLAARNLPNVLVVEVRQADPVSLVHFPKVLLTKSAVAKFEEILG
ncbi:MAG TPA: 50S ribosomal protein L4 [Accumulibacter sp.]|jgi:large subunit ribosomal protein L4|nr:50S ribosomal protein L4 [Accumulibacter sp.]